MEFDLSKRRNRERLIDFSEKLEELNEQIGFKVSARGWCYQLESFNLITKAQFDLVERWINTCRKRGFLPINFTAEEPSRKFARRFKHAEDIGLKGILLYCGDFDPNGQRISNFLRKNLNDLKDIDWNIEDNDDEFFFKSEEDEEFISGYDPKDLIIDRFGLNYDFIIENNLSWIENLITGSKGYIATLDSNGNIIQGRTASGKPHPNFHMNYAQKYLKKYGVRKCEANALVVRPEQGRKLCKQAIEKYLGIGALKRFEDKRQAIRDELDEFRKRTGLDEAIEKAIKIIEAEQEKEGGE